jgi:hypothetical protein
MKCLGCGKETPFFSWGWRWEAPSPRYGDKQVRLLFDHFRNDVREPEAREGLCELFVKTPDEVPMEMRPYEHTMTLCDCAPEPNASDSGQ